ncbi:AbiH family protein [Bifidobacterium sp. ESL0728]|uniref:AbiH family protein n=1 Tax=Bifidobacterium sp. ESL0728 TaxID=2983220 RepID=UPI0023F68950|nr:AbiH family protein [Bifidobacterium sp. ESL0728]WEV58422.1 AbiH family protein [Bifidobacterium sp. ESL0728]
MSIGQLIILGNGFDTCLGLKSRYSDFFNWRFCEHFQVRPDGKRSISSNLEGHKGLIGSNLPKQKDITLWDYIFLFECANGTRIGTWSDVESVIRKWVTTDDLQKLISSNSVSSNLFSKPLSKYAPKIHIEIRRIAEAGIGYAQKLYNDRAIDGLIDGLPGEELFGENFRILNILHNELIKFENAFASYLADACLNDYYYPNDANELYTAIKNIRIAPDTISPDSVLNFNFTNELAACKRMRHVHGLVRPSSGRSAPAKPLKSDIIFGIDEVERDAKGKRKLIDNPAAFQFTKAARTLQLDKTEQPVDVLKVFEESTEPAYIKFFGHSLGEADYSYFQSLFDHVDLYNQKVKLIFVYSTENKGEKTKDHPDGIYPYKPYSLYKNIAKLINRYGETLDNKDHGMNLLHKLILEQRIKVQPIELPNFVKSHE